ncbi:hypothetical protein [Dethiosulfovibrio salsuginis]|uniref:Uncharacterized protein n=1 Tax=Dethiosulfovibrio salsuginis TaxID=561720 RepID=A0A1X7K6W8_9BACT|nr:hypothetical protein [Dethiosulfovibrio salsuginis]SMG36118.1 hypothetical protein SAMN06275492_12118 [Dethiosulfovibrio salsuginis]
MRGIRSGFLASLILVITVAVSPVFGSPLEEATRILERNTSFHWGRDCLVWVVHYPESLVEPWVDADAQARGYSPSQREEYLRSFKEQLRIGSAEPFLVTVYHFGPQPLSLSPLGDYLSLTTDGANRVAPLSYEKKMDQPISGVVQGLVFFPKQQGAFSLVFKGLGVYPEQLFAFDKAVISDTVAQAPTEVVSRIVELPPVETETVLSSKGGKTSVPKKEPEPKAPEPEPLPPPSDTEPPAWLGPGPVLTPPDPVVEENPFEGISGDIARQLDDILKDDELEADDSSLVFSKETVVEEFLDLWSKGETEAMFDMIAPSARSEGLAAFSERANKSPLRWCLSDGYKLRWLDDGRVRVSVAQKLVLIRVLQSEVLSVVREEGRSFVVW